MLLFLFYLLLATGGTRNPNLQTLSVFFIILFYLLRAPLVARSPNVYVVITHASHVCSQHLFGLPLRKSGMHGEITRVLTICHLKPTQSMATEQNNFDLRSLLHSLTFGYY